MRQAVSKYTNALTAKFKKMINDVIVTIFVTQHKLLMYWGQFHQRSTRSFYASSLTPVEYKAKM